MDMNNLTYVVDIKNNASALPPLQSHHPSLFNFTLNNLQTLLPPTEGLLPFPTDVINVSYTAANTSFNHIQSTDDEFIVLKVVTQIICVLVLILGTSGNTLVLVVFGSRCSGLKSLEIYMVNLAVVDLIGTLVLPIYQLHASLGRSFHYIGNAGCKVVHFLGLTSITASALILVVISIDRYIVVKWPLRRRTSNLTLTIVVTVTWIVSGLLGIIYLLGDRVMLHGHGEVMVCVRNIRSMADYDEFTAHVLSISIIQVGIPLVVLIIVYSLIICKLRRTTQDETGLRLKRCKKTMKLFIVIVVMFFICVTPHHLFYLLYHFDVVNLPGHQIYSVYALLTLLLMVNSCVNPLIYSTMHAQFRRRARKMLCCCCISRHTWRDNLRESLQSPGTASARYPSSQSSRDSSWSSNRQSLKELDDLTSRTSNKVDVTQSSRSNNNAHMKKGNQRNINDTENVTSPLHIKSYETEEVCLNERYTTNYDEDDKDNLIPNVYAIYQSDEHMTEGSKEAVTCI